MAVATSVLCDRNVPSKVNEKFYETVNRPVTVYGFDCLALNKKKEIKVKVTETKMMIDGCMM